MAKSTVLAGITVLDFSRGMPGAIASLILSDYGADVIKVEPPDGDPYRKDPAWLWWNRGKKGIVLDLESADGQEQAKALAAKADVLVESFRPGELERLGLDYEALFRVNPGLIYCSITGFGQKGPLRNYKDYEGIVAAKTGRMVFLSGMSGRLGPAYAAVRTASWAASAALVRGVLAALRVRERTGRGQWVQTSLLQGMTPFDSQELIGKQLTRKFPDRYPDNTAAAMLRQPVLGYLPTRTKDGRWIQMANIFAHLFQGFLRAIDLGHLLEEERFRRAPNLPEAAREELRDIVLARMLEKTAEEWMTVFVKDGNVAAETYCTVEEGMRHPQMFVDDRVVTVQDSRVGPMTQPGVLAILSETPGVIQGPAPDLGQHTAEVLRDMAIRPAHESRRVGAETLQHPLQGVTVLDFASVHAGPYSCMLLADLGARVIKIDPTPERESRFGGNEPSGPSAQETKISAGKVGMQVDLQTPEGKAIAHKLIAAADVVVHNLRADAAKRLTLDYDSCKQTNPRIIVAALGTYGRSGPQSGRPGAQPIPGALLGAALTQAGSAFPPPPDQALGRDELREASRRMNRANDSINDQGAGIGLSTGVMLALTARDRTGTGQEVDVGMIVSNMYARGDDAYSYEGRPPLAQLDAGCHGLHALYRLYPAKEGWVFLACLFDEEWEAFCRTSGRPDLLQDARFISERDRKAHDQELVDELTKVFDTRPAVEWERVLTAADVACVQADATTMSQFYLEHPQSRENDLTVEVEHPLFGKYLRYTGACTLSEIPGRFGPGLIPGSNTRELLEELGYSAEEMEDLKERRVVNWVEVQPLGETEAASR